METPSSRESVLLEFGATGQECQELLRYGENRVVPAQSLTAADFPLEDEAFVRAWDEYERESQDVGVWACLRDKLVQLNFPIREGMSENETYRAATRRGIPISESHETPGVTLQSPGSLGLDLFATPAGRVPVISTSDRQDFVTLVQALTARNEPVQIPKSMGATLVAGYNNWDRIRRLRRVWEESHPHLDHDIEWSEEFQRIIPQKSHYQDRFMILTRGPYSAVHADDLGLETEEWDRLSFIIRREHEGTHYFTRRVLGSMRNCLLNELLADFMGILEAIGRFESAWSLRFFGLEAFPAYREGGRLQNYRGDPPLSDGAFKILQSLAVAAAHHLEQFQCQALVSPLGIRAKASLLFAMSQLSLEEFASDQAVPVLKQMFVHDDEGMGHHIG